MLYAQLLTGSTDYAAHIALVDDGMGDGAAHM